MSWRWGSLAASRRNTRQVGSKGAAASGADAPPRVHSPSAAASPRHRHQRRRQAALGELATQWRCCGAASRTTRWCGRWKTARGGRSWPTTRRSTATPRNGGARPCLLRAVRALLTLSAVGAGSGGSSAVQSRCRRPASGWRPGSWRSLGRMPHSPTSRRTSSAGQSCAPLSLSPLRSVSQLCCWCCCSVPN